MTIDELNKKYQGRRVRASGDHAFAGDDGVCLEVFWSEVRNQNMMRIQVDNGPVIFCTNKQVEFLEPSPPTSPDEKVL